MIEQSRYPGSPSSFGGWRGLNVHPHFPARPAPDGDDGAEARIGGQQIACLLYGESDVVVRKRWRAGYFGPLGAGQRFADAIDAFSQVGRSCPTRDYAVGATLGL